MNKMTVSAKDMKILNGLKKLREENNVRLRDLAREMGMSQGQLSMHESGIRGFNVYDIESFAEDYRCSINKICEFNSEFEVDRDGLVWKKVTKERLKRAREMQASGRNIIQISMELGVDEVSLEKELHSLGA